MPRPHGGMDTGVAYPAGPVLVCEGRASDLCTPYAWSVILWPCPSYGGVHAVEASRDPDVSMHFQRMPSSTAIRAIHNIKRAWVHKLYTPQVQSHPETTIPSTSHVLNDLSTPIHFQSDRTPRKAECSASSTTSPSSYFAPETLSAYTSSTHHTCLTRNVPHHAKLLQVLSSPSIHQPLHPEFSKRCSVVGVRSAR